METSIGYCCIGNNNIRGNDCSNTKQMIDKIETKEAAFSVWYATLTKALTASESALLLEGFHAGYEFGPLSHVAPKESRCCGRCDGVNDLCVADTVCDKHKVMGCEECFFVESKPFNKSELGVSMTKEDIQRSTDARMKYWLSDRRYDPNAPNECPVCKLVFNMLDNVKFEPLTCQCGKGKKTTPSDTQKIITAIYDVSLNIIDAINSK